MNNLDILLSQDGRLALQILHLCLKEEEGPELVLKKVFQRVSAGYMYLTKSVERVKSARRFVSKSNEIRVLNIENEHLKEVYRKY